MLTLIEFITNLKADISNVLTLEFELSFKEQKISIPNRNTYIGMIITPEKSSNGVVVNISALYEKLKAGIPYDILVGYAMLEIDNQFKKNPEEYLELFGKYEQIRNRLFMQAVPTEKNREKLKTVPHINAGDKSIIYRIVISEDESKVSSIVVTNNLLKTYRVRKEELHTDAVECMLERYRIKQDIKTNSVINLLRENREQIKNNSFGTNKQINNRSMETWKG